VSRLVDQLDAVAQVPILLVATDYDGTISEIVEDPGVAHPHREAIVALRMLAALPQTHVAVISGRALKDLATLTGLPEDVHLVGSHGSEFDLDYATNLSRQERELRERVALELEQIARGRNGVTLEHKPASVALHFRNASEEDARHAFEAVAQGPASIEGVYTKHGKEVVELCVVSTNKGEALSKIRHRCGASASVFLGDDVTDEDAFAILRGPDVGIKVGEGDTLAPHRISGPSEVARTLAALGERRAAWLEGAQAVPIDHHAMLTDQRAVALVNPSGTINWMSVPRPDSPALFAALVGGAAAGHFSARPLGVETPGHQDYDDDTLVVRTAWEGVTITDLLDCSQGRPNQRPGRSDLIRLIEGDAEVEIEFAPRLDFGRTPTRVRAREGGLEVEDTLDPIVLRSPGVGWTIHDEGPHHTARAVVRATPDRPITLELRYGSGRLGEDRVSLSDRVRLTRHHWHSWVESLSIPAFHGELIRRGALLLKGLCHAPSGAILAAGTTSLPEHIGGVRNWDYRYCWIRDAAMTATTLTRLGSDTEAMALLNWICAVVSSCESPERLQPLYAVSGAELGTEAEITELSGYKGSRPVRVGNMAARQVQLDVFGPVVDLIAHLVDSGAPLSSEHWRLVESMTLAVERRWGEPDHGIWEIRAARRHHVHSKTMCWLTVDRAIGIAHHFLERDMPRWEDLRSRIADDIHANGYNDSVGAFTAAYDGTDLDAAALMVGLSGLVEPTDERFVSTVDAVERVLRDGPTVYRYITDDGLPGTEGGFHICACWLVVALHRIGREGDARSLFEDICALSGPSGVLSEQHDPVRGVALGNTPQAYSHLALIDTALELGAAR